MLIRNSNISTRQVPVPKGRKINNNVNLHVTTGTHGYSQDHQKRCLDFQQPYELGDFKKPSRSILTKNKENLDTNLPAKRSLMKAQSTKSIPKPKKNNILTKSTVIHKKGDSARSSLSKRSKSQINLAIKKQQNNRKSLSPKVLTLTTNRTSKPLLSQRDTKTNKGKQTQRQKKKQISVNSSRNQKKKKVVEPHLLLNDESIQIARELESMHKNQAKFKKTGKKQSLQKHQKKIIVSSNVSKHRRLDSSRDSPDMAILTQRYKMTKKSSSATNNTIKPKPKEHNLPICQKFRKQHFAAITIQTAFREYLQYKNCNKIIFSIVTIQRWWRNYLRVKHSSELPRLVGQSSLVTIKDFQYDTDQKNNKHLNIQLVEQSKQQKIKDRIKHLLEEGDSLLQSNKHSITKKILFSPLKERQEINLPLKIPSPRQSIQPWNLVQNLPNLQKFHKQKLIKNFNSQKQAIVKLWQEKLCSPRTQQGRLKDLDNWLNKELTRFQAGVKEVLRGWNLTKQQQMIHLSDESPSHRRTQEQLVIQIENAQSYAGSYNLPVSQSRAQIKQISDISIQLSGVKQISQHKDGKELTSLKFDSSLQGIELYLGALSEYFIQQGGWKQEFLESINESRGITMGQLLANLDYVEEENPSTFLLPRYKNYVDENDDVISNQRIEQFNREYPRLRSNQKNQQIQQIGEYQYFHIQAVVDAFNEQFHRQRPKNSLISHRKRNRFQSREQKLIPVIFSQVCDQIIKISSSLCGLIDETNEVEEGCLLKIHQTRLRHTLLADMKMAMEDQKMEQQQIETKVSLGEEVFLDIFHEAIYELYQVMNL